MSDLFKLFAEELHSEGRPASELRDVSSGCSCKPSSSTSDSYTVVSETLADRFNGERPPWREEAPASSDRTPCDATRERIDWTPSQIADQHEITCGTPDDLPLEYVWQTPLSHAMHRPEGYQRRGLTRAASNPSTLLLDSALTDGPQIGYDSNPPSYPIEPIYQTNPLPPMADEHEENELPKAGPANGLRALFHIPAGPAPTMSAGAVAVSTTEITACFNYLYTAWFTTVAALNSSRRVRRQWWYYVDDALFSPGYWVGRYGPVKLTQLAEALTVACARMTGGIYKGVIQDDLTMVKDNGMTCKTGVSDCEVDGGTFRVCKDWDSYTTAEREVRMMAALLVNDVTKNRGTLIAGSGVYTDNEENAALIENAYNIARWAWHRYAEYQFSTRELHMQWDRRPDKSYLPLFPAVIPRVYSTWPKNQINHSQLRRAWDYSWCYVESAMRFLYKMSYLTPTQIEDMWYFGTGRDPSLSTRFFVGERQRETIVDNSREVAPASQSSDYMPSMRVYFGEYSHQNFLTVYRVVLCHALRYESNYSRGNTHMREHFRLYPGNGKSYGALAFPTGEVDLHKKFFDGDDLYRSRTIAHELLHYLIRWDAGGRPRDWKSPSICSGGKDNKCYGEDECVALADVNDYRCRANNNNYVYWMYGRWRRWGGDWPPENERSAGETWHNDPIPDSQWENHTYNRVVDIGWQRLDALEEAMNEEGFMPW